MISFETTITQGGSLRKAGECAEFTYFRVIVSLSIRKCIKILEFRVLLSQKLHMNGVFFRDYNIAEPVFHCLNLKLRIYGRILLRYGKSVT